MILNITFTEILIIGVIAILFLGPDKLPEAMVEIAKFFRNVKRTVSSAKESLEQEMHITDIKEEALNYKKELTSGSSELSRLTNLDDLSSEVDDIKEAAKVDAKQSEKPAPAEPQKPEVVTFAKSKSDEPKEEKS